MNCESLRKELQKKIDEFKKKWMPKCKEEYDGDIKKLYTENASGIVNDVYPIWELCAQIDYIDTISKFATDEELNRIADKWNSILLNNILQGEATL